MFPIKGPPHRSLAIVDVIAALAVVEGADAVRDKRVMGLRVEDADTLTVRTGEAPGALTGGGQIVRVERGGGGWRVASVESWCS